MNLEQFQIQIKDLFGDELVKHEDDEYGYTFISKTSFSKIGYATNLTLETIQEAALNHVDLMITHHDAWDFLYGMKDQCMKKLEENNITHFFIHAPLDYIEFGTCTSLMNILEVDVIKQYSHYENGNEFPSIGFFNHSISFKNLVKLMSEKLNEPVSAWKNNDQMIKTIAVLTGAGDSTTVIKRALEAGCDTYITGEATLYAIQYAKFARINLIAGSHTFTEIFGIESLAKKLKDLNPQIEIIRLEEEHFEAKVKQRDGSNASSKH
ncbi:Nif3-like dinuclear metal center hexameric protein [Heyndrickxia oleronia]|uniref:Nif3-like dinuclear metal center hexameric protein n=1 Tax=Heyndrickxia oleronia TaxID=38875 RepID=UPI00203FEF48|nr:Nif3-like dinuclear metal center hexameric protein [Heyndrickxia oleronia]MCM3455160.1 Nif3-like dinuclear metal center hexameric protein [Heyndrickxia oleronia]